MPYLLSQHSDTQMGMYNQPRVRLLWLIFQWKNSKTKITTTKNISKVHTEFFHAPQSILRRQLYILIPVLTPNVPDTWKPPVAQYLEPIMWIMGADSCFGSSSTVVIWVPLLLTQAYTVQASIWWRGTRCSHIQLQKFFSSTTCLDFLFTQDIILFYLRDSIQPGKYCNFEISISAKDILHCITFSHTTFKRRVHASLWH